MEADIAYDSTKFIDASIAEVEKTLLEAAAIVVLVIFLFLGSLRSTLIPIVTIPLSLISVMFALRRSAARSICSTAGAGAGHPLSSTMPSSSSRISTGTSRRA
jgi:Cu/Ag efflux pump CusA